MIGRRGLIGALLATPLILRLPSMGRLVPQTSLTPNVDWLERQWRLGIPVVGVVMELERPPLLKSWFGGASGEIRDSYFHVSNLTPGSALVTLIGNEGGLIADCTFRRAPGYDQVQTTGIHVLT